MLNNKSGDGKKFSSDFMARRSGGLPQLGFEDTDNVDTIYPTMRVPGLRPGQMPQLKHQPDQ